MASHIQIKRIEKMKKLLLSIALLGGVVLTSQGQTDKGDVILGGNVSFNTIKPDASGANSSYDLSIVPNVGYFVDDNIAIGTGIGYQTSRLDEASELGKTEAFVIAPFGRYYAPISNNFKFFEIGRASCRERVWIAVAD